MICYKDRAFCSVPCGYLPCSRRVSDELIKEAEDFGLPISYMNLKCENYIKPKVTESGWPAKKGGIQ